MNTSGESIYQTIYEYQEVLRYQNPKAVIIEPYTIYAGLTPQNLKPWNFSFFYSMPIGFRKLKYSHDFFTDGDLLKFYLPYTSSHSDWKNPNLFFSRVDSELESISDLRDFFKPVELPHKGYENYLKSLTPWELEIESPGQNDPCPIPDFEDRLSVTEDILQKSNKHLGELFFIETPQYINKFENCRAQAVNLINRYEVPYTILFKEQDLPLLWFGDHQHMTQFGAIIASVETAEFLSDELNIEMNAEALNYYQSYFFIDYTIVQEGEKISINLVPYDKETFTDLIFKWEVFLNDKSILRIKAKGKNEITYTIPEPIGNYFIHIVIVNPTGNYPLRGGFDFVLEE